MSNLNDTQSVLLAAAGQRDSASIYPLPESLAPCARVTNAITKLLGSALLEERETRDAVEVSRKDGDLLFGLYITPAGLEAIGIGLPVSDSDEVHSPSQPTDVFNAAHRETKASQVLALLRRPEGATLGGLMESTGWLPHTTRAALTGLRNKGNAVERSKRGDDTCYFVRQASIA